MKHAPLILAVMLIAAILAAALVLEPVPCAVAGGCTTEVAPGASAPVLQS
jgi:hypothetical protein